MILENMDLPLLVMDEIIDNGIILETDAAMVRSAQKHAFLPVHELVCVVRLRLCPCQHLSLIDTASTCAGGGSRLDAQLGRAQHGRAPQNSRDNSRRPPQRTGRAAVRCKREGASAEFPPLLMGQA